MSCSMNVYASEIFYQQNQGESTTDKTNNFTYHTIPDKCGTNLCSDKDYDLQGTSGDKMIIIIIIKQ